MIKPSINLQELRRRIYRKAKAELAGRGGVADSVKVLPAEQAYSALQVKGSGKPDDRKGQVRFDVAGAGNGFTVRLVRHRQTKETVNR